MSDQAKQPESDGERSDRGRAYSGNPHSVLAACRSAGEARGLTSEVPLYAHLLGLAHRLDDPFLSDQYVSALSSEFRQALKVLGLDKVESPQKKEDSVLVSLQSRINRPTRGA